MITKLQVLATAILAVSLVCSASPAIPAEDEKQLIAVLDLEGVSASDAETIALTDRLREVLLKSGQFTLVDRSQMDAVLNEQALQQTGCTEQECAVTVGQILGVRKIIAGKVVKISDTIWLLSALMVDVETAETLLAESIRHRGDYFSLMDEQVMALGQKLAVSTLRAPATAEETQIAASRAPGPPPPTPPQPVDVRKRVAVFPPLFTGSRVTDMLSYRNPEFHGTIEQALARLSDEFTISHTFDPKLIVSDRHKPKNIGTHQGIDENTWSGFFSKSPNEGYIYATGRSLSVDLVLLYKITADDGRGGSYGLYLYDVKRRHAFLQEGFYLVEDLLLKLHSGFRQLLADFLEF